MDTQIKDAHLTIQLDSKTGEAYVAMQRQKVYVENGTFLIVVLLIVWGIRTIWNDQKKKENH